jgi:hypothetical protein
VGTVAEEAARLLDALGGWATASASGTSGTDTPGTRSHGSDRTGASGASAAAGSEPGPCPHCGAQDGAGQAVVCRLCPVCQGINLLRSVRPETVDRLADLAGAVASTLRDLADQRREATAPPQPQPGAAARGRHGSRVQDIPVVDDAEDVLGGDGDAGARRATR